MRSLRQRQSAFPASVAHDDHGRSCECKAQAGNYLAPSAAEPAYRKRSGRQVCSSALTYPLNEGGSAKALVLLEYSAGDNAGTEIFTHCADGDVADWGFLQLRFCSLQHSGASVHWADVIGATATELPHVPRDLQVLVEDHEVAGGGR